MSTTIQVTSKKGLRFPIEAKASAGLSKATVRFYAGKALIDLNAGTKETSGAPYIEIGSYAMKEAKKHLIPHVPAFKGLKNKRTLITLTNEEYARIQSIVEEIKKPAIEEIKKRKEREAAQPKVWVAYDFLDWGDYSINHERNIYLCREPLPEETQTLKVVETTANLWNDRIGDYKEEWEALDGERREVGNLITEGIVLSSKEAEKWNRVSVDADRKEQEAKDAAEAERKAKEEALKAERKAKFAEAKETGKRVLLSSHFCMGRDIPRKFRDEDSDMGHLCVWARPDGTTEESFSHAY